MLIQINSNNMLLNDDEIINALRRAFDGRGHPSLVYTDNERSFRWAGRELSMPWKEANPKRLGQGFPEMEI